MSVSLRVRLTHLFFEGWVEAGFEDKDVRGSSEVDAHSSRPHGEEEEGRGGSLRATQHDMTGSNRGSVSQSVGGS